MWFVGHGGVPLKSCPPLFVLLHCTLPPRGTATGPKAWGQLAVSWNLTLRARVNLFPLEADCLRCLFGDAKSPNKIMFILFKEISRNNRTALLNKFPSCYSWEPGFHGSSLLAVLIMRPSATSAEFQMCRFPARAGPLLPVLTPPVKIQAPVVMAALIRPFPNTCFSLGCISKLWRPPCTDIKSLGSSSCQSFTMRWSKESGLVS